MDEVGLLLKAYWEQLHDRLVENRELLAAKIETILKKEIAQSRFPGFDKDKYTAYRDAAFDFLEERIEAYNPVGLQYLFDANRRQEAAELEFGLDWFNSKEEFQRLLDATARKAVPGMNDEQLYQAACVLISEMGAYPDNSIIAGFETSPELKKLPDYIVAKALEELFAESH